MDILEKAQGISFNIIAVAGDAKALAYEALRAAKDKNAELYNSKMEEAETTVNEAHKSQFELLQMEAKGELANMAFSILVVHAQDHLMTVMSTIDLIKELAELHLSK